MSNEAPNDTLRLVPVEPTEAMLDAAFDAFEINHPMQYRTGTEARKAIWSAMLAAAPASPLPGGGDDDTVVDLAEALRLLEEVAPLAICWATHYASSRGFEQHPHHKALNEHIRAFLARNGKGEG